MYSAPAYPGQITAWAIPKLYWSALETEALLLDLEIEHRTDDVVVRACGRREASVFGRCVQQAISLVFQTRGWRRLGARLAQLFGGVWRPTGVHMTTGDDACVSVVWENERGEAAALLQVGEKLSFGWRHKGSWATMPWDRMPIILRQAVAQGC